MNKLLTPFFSFMNNGSRRINFFGVFSHVLRIAIAEEKNNSKVDVFLSTIACAKALTKTKNTKIPGRDLDIQINH